MSQQPDNHTNLMVAIFLSLAVMVGWQYFVAGPKVKQEQARIEREKQEQAGKQPAAGTPPASLYSAAGAGKNMCWVLPAFRMALARHAAIPAGTSMDEHEFFVALGLTDP